MGKSKAALTQANTFRSSNPTIDLIMRCVKHHVLMGLANKTKDPTQKKTLEEQAQQIRGDIGAHAYDDALKLIARTGFVAQQAHGWARVAITQIGMKGKFQFGDVVIEVV